MPVKRDPRTGGWFFRTVVTFADGRRKRIFGTPGVPGPYQDLAQSKVGAQAAERRAISDALNGTPAPREASATKETSKTISEHAEGFLETYRPESKPSEKREKRRVINSHLLPVFGQVTIEDLKQADIDAFAASELKRGMAIKTVNNRLAVLSTMIKYVTGERSPLRFKLAGMAGELHAVDPADVDRLLAAAELERDRVAILLAAEAGLRCGEIRGLQWTDIKDGQLTVRRALDKATGEIVPPKHNKTRTIPLSPRLVTTLAKLPRVGLWVVAQADGGAVSYDRLSESFSAIYVCAGVPRPPKPIHCLRHSFGTMMARRVPLGVLQKLLGHADVQTTMRYVDVNEDDKRNAIAAVFGPAVAATWQRTSGRSGGTP